MPAIRITEFGGMKPKEVRHFGQNGRADLARDVKLWHGTLESWRYPSLEVQTNLDKICSLYKQDCCYIASENKCADFTRGDTDCKIVYSTGHMPWPAYAILPDDCNTCCYEELDWCRLGVPNPVNSPEILDSDPVEPPIPMPEVTGGSFDCESEEEIDYCADPAVAEPWQSDAGEQLQREPRSYVYTFVDDQGNESSPSMPSEVIDVDINGCATLGFNIPPLEDGFKVATIRIYRGVPLWGNPELPVSVNAGAGTGLNYEDMVSSDYFFVEEIPFQEGIFSHEDCITADCLGETSPSCCHAPPPDCLENLLITDNGTLVGTEGKNVWFSEPWRFHAWSCNLNLDHCARSIIYCRGYIYVATDSHPYLIDEQFGDEDCYCCRQVQKIEAQLPITCKESMVKTDTGVMWATNTGLVKMDGPTVQMNTHEYLSEDDWQKYKPHQIRAAYNKGRYFGFNSEGGFIWDVGDGIYSDSFIGQTARLSELSLTPDAVFNTDQEELMLSFDGNIYRWDNSDTFMPYLWRSKLHVEGGLRNYSAMKVVFKDWLRTRKAPNPVTIRFYADDKLIFAREITCSKPFRLPKGFDALNFQIEIQGIEEVMEFHMATSMQELTLINNA